MSNKTYNDLIQDALNIVAEQIEKYSSISKKRKFSQAEVKEFKSITDTLLSISKDVQAMANAKLKGKSKQEIIAAAEQALRDIKDGLDE